MAKHTCKYPECETPVGRHGAKGYCPYHYRATRQPCSVEGCEKRVRARGWCSTHYTRWKTTGDPRKTVSGRKVRPPGKCSFEGCQNPRRKRDWCTQHYDQFRRTGRVWAFKYTWQDSAGHACAICGEPTTTRSAYCGRACSQAASRWGQSGENRPEAFVCVLCGKQADLTGRSEGRLQRTDTIYCKECGRTSREAYRLKRYRVGIEEYAEALEAGCQICGSHPEVLHIDHDHSCCAADQSALCGKCNRGFLCGNCNRGLGCFRDNPQWLSEAAKYLINS